MTTIEQRTAPARGGAAPRAGGERGARVSPLLITLGSAAGLLVLSTVILLWARTRPGFDPFGWLVWGRQTVAGNLDTNAAPSWKPLPYLFTVPYAVFGHYQLWLWMITALAVSLSGCVFAGRIAYRLTGAESDRRYAAYAAAAFAGLALLGISDYWHYMLSAQTDPMIVALCLAAIDCHLSGRPRLAFVLGALAGLGRPEVWLFLGLYSIWAWLKIPSMRWLIVAGILAMVLLWFAIPALSSRSAFVAASNALGSGRRLRSDRVFGTIHRFLDLNAVVLEVTALIAVAIAAVRRDRITLALAGGMCAWVIVEIGFSLHGWPGLGRYMFEPAGVLVAIAGAGLGWLLADLPRAPRMAGRAGAGDPPRASGETEGAGPGDPPRASGEAKGAGAGDPPRASGETEEAGAEDPPRASGEAEGAGAGDPPRASGEAMGASAGDRPRVPGMARWAGAAVGALIVLALVPPAITRARNEHHDIRVQRVRTVQINQLSSTISRLGGPSRFTRCGEPLTRLEFQTILAWMLHVNVATVGYKYGPAIHSSRPIVLFTPSSHGGWRVQALHQRLPACRSLPR